MASRRIEERRAQHKRYKEDVERTGKPFFPYAMFHDTVMSLVVVCVIIGLACVWYFTAEGSTDPGWLGPHYTERGRPGHDQLRAAARLVLLLPLLPAADLQVAGHGRARHRRHPEHPARDPDRAAVHRPAPRAPALAAPGRDRRGDRRRAGDGHADLQGRDREGVARLRDDRRKCRSGPRSRASRTTRRRSRARSSSRSPAACSATPTSAPARPTSARPTSATSARRARASPTSSATSRTRPQFGNTGDAAVRRPRRGEPAQIAVFLDASKGPKG